MLCQWSRPAVSESAATRKHGGVSGITPGLKSQSSHWHHIVESSLEQNVLILTLSLALSLSLVSRYVAWNGPFVMSQSAPMPQQHLDGKRKAQLDIDAKNRELLEKGCKHRGENMLI